MNLGIVEVKARHMPLPEKLFPLWLRGHELLGIKVEEGRIIISPLEVACPFCSRMGVIPFEGYLVCSLCRDGLKRARKSKRGRKSSRWIQNKW